MTELEQTLADTILIQANNLSHDTKVVLRMTQAYQTLQDAVATRVRSVNYHNAYVKLQSQSTPLWGCEDAEPSVCTTPLWVCPEEEAPAPPETAVTDAKPKRTRRTKEQIAADEAAAAAAEVAPEPEPTPEPTPEPEPAPVELDDDLADEPEPEAPTITRGQVQELFTHKLKVIGAGGVAPVNAFKGKVRELLAKYDAPGGVSTVPDENLVAFHAELANLA
jgi:outer membrane biosynthesis protein TonB